MGLKGASAVLLVDDKCVLQLRDEHALTYPNQWGLFGGHIEPGESAGAAVVREIREELEIELREPRLLFVMQEVAVYVEDVTAAWYRRVLHEGKAAGLFAFEEAMQLGLNDVTTAAIHAARRRRAL